MGHAAPPPALPVEVPGLCETSPAQSSSNVIVLFIRYVGTVTSPGGAEVNVSKLPGSVAVRVGVVSLTV